MRGVEITFMTSHSEYSSNIKMLADVCLYNSSSWLELQMVDNGSRCYNLLGNMPWCSSDLLEQASVCVHA